MSECVPGPDVSRLPANTQFRARGNPEELAHLKAALDEHAIVAITDPAGSITYVNDRFCRISQYSEAELLGQNHRIINSGHHAPRFFEALWEAIADGQVWKGEICNRAKDGSLYWVDTTIVPFLDAAGLPYQYVAIRADITLRKRAEQALKSTLNELAQLKTALDEHAIVAKTDPAGQIIYVNEKFCRISQYSATELLGQNHRIINSGHHLPAFFTDLWETISGGQVWKGEICNRAKDGSSYWVDTTIVPFLDESGLPYQYIAIRADITERKAAESALRQSEERLRIVIDHEPHCVKIVSPEGQLLYMNPAGLRMIEAPALEALVGQPIVSLIHAADRADFLDFSRRVMQGDKATQQFRICGLQGTERWVESHSVPLRMPDQASPSVLSVTMDITERRASQAALEALNNELDYRVSVRTEQLEAANRELEAFSYSVSHDLRSPLIAIDGFSHVLQAAVGDQLDERGRHALRRIRVGVSHMAELIEALLNLAQISRTALRWQPVDLSAMALDIAARLRDEAPARHAEFQVAPDMRVSADPKLLRQVMENLMSNAWKFTALKAPARIEIGQEAEDDGRPTFHVRDNGAGFDMAHSYRLFTAFHRLHAKADYPGTGIGLATVRRIVERHHGRVWADAVPAQGAVFYFSIGSPEPSGA